MYLMCDFGYKPLRLVAGTKRYNKTIKALGDAQEKFTTKAKKIANSRLSKEIEIAKINRGLSPMELPRDIESLNKKKLPDRIDPNYSKQLGKNKYDNMKPSDLDTTKSRRFLPFKPKPDSPLNEKSPISLRDDIFANAAVDMFKQGQANLRGVKANNVRNSLALDGLSQQLMKSSSTAKDRNKAYRTFDRISGKKFKPVTD